jgi:hypothetical protein
VPDTAPRVGKLPEQVLESLPSGDAS